MKVVLVLVLASLSAVFAEDIRYKPEVNFVLDQQNTLHVSAYNDTATDYFCKFNVSRFVNGLHWKSDFGTVVLRGEETLELEYKHDLTDYVTGIRVSFRCN